MDKETGPGAKISENPLLARLLVAEGAENAIALRGYVGPSRAEGYINLYPNLYDLSESLEVAQADVLHFAEVPETAMPFGATILWVKKDAQIVHRQGEAAENTGAAEIRKGRLRIQLGMRRTEGVCTSRCSSCQSRCRTCQSRCNTCQSRCRPT